MKTVILFAGLLLVASFGLARAHDMADMPGMDHGPNHMDYAFGHPAKESDAKRAIAVTMREMKFAPAAIVVRSGETVRFVVTNTDDVEHEMVLGDAAIQADHRREMLEMARSGGTMHDHADPNAVNVDPGKTADLVWTFTKPGRIEFDCDIPGHYEAGMKGVIEIR